MSSSSRGEKSKRKRVKNLFKELFQSPSTSGSDIQQPGIILSSTTQSPNHDTASGSDTQLDGQEHGIVSSSIVQSDANEVLQGNPSPPPSQLNIRQPEITLPPSLAIDLDYTEEGFNEISSPSVGQISTNDSFGGAGHSSTTQVSGTIVPATTNPNIKEGLGIAGRFVQTLLKKLPDCVDGNPVKMTLSIVKTIINIKDEIGDNKDALTEGLRRTQRLLSDAIGKVDFHDSDEVKKEMDDYRRKIEEQNMQLLQIARELESMLRHVDYENYKKKINSVCKEINEITDVFMFRMQVEMRTKMALMHERIKEEQKARLTKSLQDLKPSAKADHRTVIEGQNLKRELCTEGTRVKILEDITDWANDRTKHSPHVFWLTGQAGSGKTTIAYTIAKRFENGQPTILGANFLCSRQFEETRSLHRIIPTISYQLACKCGPYEAALHAHVTDKSVVVHHDVSEQLQEFIIGPWYNVKPPNDLPTYLVVIDALDEINEDGGSKFLGVLLRAINQHHFVGLKFLVTSRTDPRIVDLCDTFHSKAVCRLQDVPIEDAEADVEKYLDTKLPKIAGSSELAELRNRASGLFVYAATAVRILTTARSITYKEQMRKLNNLLSKPSGLSSVGNDKSPIDGLYEQILYEAFSDFTDEEDLAPRLRILFTFLCAAERISTSVAATLIDDDDNELARAVLNDLHAVLYIQDGRIFWYHSSFPDFLFAQNRSNFRIGDKKFDLWCDEAIQHNRLALSCLRVMTSDVYGLRFNMGDIASSYLLDAEHLDELSEHVNKNIAPVLRYSSFHWARHLSSISVVQNVDNICTFLSKFLQIRVLFWIEAMNLLGSSNQCTDMLHLARQWVLNSKCTTDTKAALARDLLECANFTTHFAGSPAAESTPHLYISSLATWKQQSNLSQNWKHQFSRIPVFTHGNADNEVPLLTIRVPDTRIHVVTFSNDGTRIASGSDDGRVRIWNATTGKEVKNLEGHLSVVFSIAFSSDDKWVVSGSYDYTVRVWDITTGNCLKEAILDVGTDKVTSVAFLKDSMRIVAGSINPSTRAIRVWDVLTGDTIQVLMGHTDLVNSVAFSGDGAWIVSGSNDRSVRLWGTSKDKEIRVMTGHTGWVTSVAISGDNARIASGSCDCSVRLWDTATAGKELRVMKGHGNTVNSVAFSGNGAWVISGSDDRSVRVWDASTGEALKILKGHTNWVQSIAFSSNATRVVSGSQDASIRVWDVSRRTQLDELEGDTHPVTSVAFSRDGTRILLGSDDGSLHISDATTKKELKVLKEGNQSVSTIAISNDGTHIACELEGKLRLWAVSESDLEVKDLKVLEDWPRGDIYSVAFSRDGNLILCGLESGLVLWDVLNGVPSWKATFGPIDSGLSVAFSGDGKKIASGSRSKSVRVLDASTVENLQRVTGHKGEILSVAFSSDSALIVSGSNDNTARVWDISIGTELKVLHGHTESVCSVAFSNDDTYIVSGSYDHSVRVWKASTGKEINALRGCHSDYVYYVAFSSDNRSIISGSRDKSVILWALDEPIWRLAELNWILSSPTNDRLMWVPPDAQVLNRSNCRIIIGQSTYSFVDFEQSMQAIGPTWQQCYTPTTHLNS